jgi:hypothetical protein
MRGRALVDPAARGRVWVAHAALSIALAASIASVRYLPTNDGPQHVFAAHAANVLGGGHDPSRATLDAQLVASPQWTYLGFSAPYRPLERTLGWQAALRVLLAAWALGHAWAVVLLVRVVAARRGGLRTPSDAAQIGPQPAEWLAYAYALPWTLYMGFFPEVAGEVAGLLAIALYLARVRVKRGVARDIAWTGALIVASVAHLVAGALSAVAVAILALAGAGEATADASNASPNRRRALHAAVALAPTLLLAVSLVVASAGSVPNAIEGADSTVWHSLGDLALLPQLLMPGPLWRAVLAAILMLAAIAAVARSLVLDRRDNPRAPPLAKALAIAAAVTIAMTVAAPLHVPGVQFLSPRALPYGVALLLAATAACGSWPRPISWAALAFALGSIAVGAAWHGNLASACSDVLDAVDAPLHRRGLRLALSVGARCGGDDAASAPDRGVPFDAPLRHMGALFPVAQGGTIEHLFLGAPVHAFSGREDGPLHVPVPNALAVWDAGMHPEVVANPSWQASFGTEMALYGAVYEDVVLLGIPAGVTRELQRRGYVADVAGTRIVVAHFVPCPSSLHFELPDGRGVHVAFGAGGVDTPLWDLDLPPPPRAPAMLDVPVGPRVCGPVWLRLSPAGATDGTGRAPVAVRCAGAEPDGRMNGTLGGQAGPVRCVVEWL